MRANESITSAVADAYSSIKNYRDKRNQRDPRLNPEVIKKVAFTGFDDFRRRLLAAGINLKDKRSTKTPAIQEKIKENVIKYVEQYMTSRENARAKPLILSDFHSKLSLPNEFDENTLYKYFEDAANIRAKKLVALDLELPSNVQSVDETEKLKQLQSSLEDNQEIVFSYARNKVTVVIRKSGVYVSDYIGRIKPGISLPPTTEVEPHGDMFSVKRPENLKKIYLEYEKLPSKPAPQNFIGATLE